MISLFLLHIIIASTTILMLLLSHHCQNFIAI